MSIATKRGDAGQTGLAGGIRVSKAELRVGTYGSTDELKTVLGFARSLCGDVEIVAWTMQIQRTLFRVGSALATPPESRKLPPVISDEDVAMLTELVRRMEAEVGDTIRALPGGDRVSAAYAVAETVCRRAQRTVVRFAEGGAVVQPAIPVYLDRLSEVIGLVARRVALAAEAER